MCFSLLDGLIRSFNLFYRRLILFCIFSLSGLCFFRSSRLIWIYWLSWVCRLVWIIWICRLVRVIWICRTTDVTGIITLPEGTEMAMPGDNLEFDVELITPIAIEEGLRFAIREGGRTVGSGVVTKINE